MPHVDADPQSLRDVRAALTRCQNDIDKSLASVRSTVKSAHWNDDRRRQFDRDLEGLLGQISTFSRKADDLKSYLGRKADELDRFLSH
ncbi:MULTISPECIES: hypothetical protein [unclassified Rathayibacter]|uniref:hypothetical protein n=1 Tax=unclassified Rathayibacter TaxID=2609250 RepID=UPI0006F54871|nr:MULTISPECIES: hypothetical protein [unclassified Rathayibacter]KQQ05737.1 hypothetical protein ASF42_04005 [Rathayibacter sp. Leaf294]KQS13595.1 hypothetical protein ASG06_04015 [Rathayibacter sp. Leaf185]